MATSQPRNKQSRTNAHGVTAPVRPKKTSGSNGDFSAQLKHVTAKHSAAIKLLAER